MKFTDSISEVKKYAGNSVLVWLIGAFRPSPYRLVQSWARDLRSSSQDQGAWLYSDSKEKDLHSPRVSKLVRGKPDAAYETTTTKSNHWAYLEIKPTQEGRAKEHRKLNFWLHILSTCVSSLFLKHMSQWFVLYISGIFSWLSVTFNQKNWFILQQMSSYSLCFRIFLWGYQRRPTQAVSRFWYQVGWFQRFPKSELEVTDYFVHVSRFGSITTIDHPLFSSVQFSRSVMSDSLWSHGLQHARLPCP